MSSVPWCGHSGLLRIQTIKLGNGPNFRSETQPERWSRFASKRTLVRFAWDVKANAPRSDQVLKIIRLFGRNRHPLSRAHYKNYCLISVNSKISRTLSDRRVKMNRGSTLSKEETERLLDKKLSKRHSVSSLFHVEPRLNFARRSDKSE